MSKTSRGKRKTPVPSAVLDAVFQALAHPVRRQILAVLSVRGGVMTAGEIADRFRHSWPTTTRHLGVLEKARIVDVVKSGRNRQYVLQAERLVDVSEWLFVSSAKAVETVHSDARPEWASLQYASMRNAVRRMK